MLKLFYLTLFEYISCILIIDAAVSSTDFLVTSITGHLYFLKVFLAMFTSFLIGQLLFLLLRGLKLWRTARRRKL